MWLYFIFLQFIKAAMQHQTGSFSRASQFLRFPLAMHWYPEGVNTTEWKHCNGNSYKQILTFDMLCVDAVPSPGPSLGWSSRQPASFVLFPFWQKPLPSSCALWWGLHWQIVEKGSEGVNIQDRYKRKLKIYIKKDSSQALVDKERKNTHIQAGKTNITIQAINTSHRTHDGNVRNRPFIVTRTPLKIWAYPPETCVQRNRTGKGEGQAGLHQELYT